MKIKGRAPSALPNPPIVKIKPCIWELNMCECFHLLFIKAMSYNIYSLFFQGIDLKCGTRSDGGPCSSDEIDEEAIFPHLQSQNQVSVDSLDSDASICFPVFKNVNGSVSKASSPICVSKSDVVPCSSNEIVDRTNFPAVDSPNNLSSEVLCNSDASQKTKNDYVTVSKASKPGEKRVYDKKHRCVYCNGMYAKMHRHLEQKHSDETDVAFALSLPKNSKKRKRKWNDLLKRGDFNHNMEVIQTNSGLIIPCKRPSKDIDASNFLPCPHCFGMYRRKDLWKHVNTCNDNKKEGKSKNTQTEARMLLPMPPNVSKDFYEKIICTMISDKVSNIVKNDSLLLSFGERIFLKSKGLPHQYNYVRQKIRELARLLLIMKKNTSATSLQLKDCIDPAMFYQVVIAVRSLCGCNEQAHFEKASLSLKLGHSLKKCAALLKSQALQSGDEVLKKKSSDFIELYESDWSVEISSKSLQTMQEQNLNKTKRIPFAKDIQLLNSFLEKEANQLKDQLDKMSDCPDIESWKKLNEISLAQIILFNRRRGGETERIELQHFTDSIETASRSEMQEEVESSLSMFEKKLASSLSRIEIRGKRGRRVPILLTKKHKERLNCLIKYRKSVGIDKKNKYLFPRSQSTQSCLRSSDILRKFALACGAKQPDLLTSTSLRKHVATISQILNLKNNELDSLASFLGHDIKVHRNFYVMPENTVQVAKIGKILTGLETGQISKFKGKSLDEIEMDEEEELELQPEEYQITDVEDEDNGSAAEKIDTELDNQPSTLNSAPMRKQTLNKKKSSRKQTTKIPWSPDEKASIMNTFSKFFSLNKLPGKAEIEEVKRSESVLHRRPWQQIKFFYKKC